MFLYLGYDSEAYFLPRQWKVESIQRNHVRSVARMLVWRFIRIPADLFSFFLKIVLEYYWTKHVRFIIPVQATWGNFASIDCYFHPNTLPNSESNCNILISAWEVKTGIAYLFFPISTPLLNIADSSSCPNGTSYESPSSAQQSNVLLMMQMHLGSNKGRISQIPLIS